MADFEDIRRQVVDAGGIKCLKMQKLRDASPYKKLGPGVNAEIATALSQKGLGHTTLPLYQEQPVYVYEHGSAAAKLMLAVTGTPSEEGANEILRSVKPSGSGDSTEAKLNEIRALLVQLQDVFNEPHPEE